MNVKTPSGRVFKVTKVLDKKKKGRKLVTTISYELTVKSYSYETNKNVRTKDR